VRQGEGKRELSNAGRRQSFARSRGRLEVAFEDVEARIHGISLSAKNKRRIRETDFREGENLLNSKTRKSKGDESRCPYIRAMRANL
jgi:hypothetical protein